MELTALQVHKRWLIPAVLVLLVTAFADVLTACFVSRPILWCALISSSLPISMFVFVAMPILRQEKWKS
jgi:hypothetical protein